MRAVILQPAYPADATTAGAEHCQRWMLARLDALQPAAQDLVLLPEYATTAGLEDPAALRGFAGQQGAGFLRRVADHARRLSCLLAVGGIARSGARWFNRIFVFDGSGRQIFAYDKIHLTAAEESGWELAPGDDNSVLITAACASASPPASTSIFRSILPLWPDNKPMWCSAPVTSAASRPTAFARSPKPGPWTPVFTCCVLRMRCPRPFPRAAIPSPPAPTAACWPTRATPPVCCGWSSTPRANSSNPPRTASRWWSTVLY